MTNAATPNDPTARCELLDLCNSFRDSVQEAESDLLALDASAQLEKVRANFAKVCEIIAKAQELGLIDLNSFMVSFDKSMGEDVRYWIGADAEIRMEEEEGFHHFFIKAANGDERAFDYKTDVRQPVRAVANAIRKSLKADGYVVPLVAS